MTEAFLNWSRVDVASVDPAWIDVTRGCSCADVNHWSLKTWQQMPGNYHLPLFVTADSPMAQWILDHP